MSSPYFQKSKYILINSLDEIDPRRINIRDLHNKYMDSEGNRYALRFDLNKREIQVVRLAGSRDEAIRIRSEVLKQRRFHRERKDDELEFVFEPDESDNPFQGDLPDPLLSYVPTSHSETTQEPSRLPERRPEFKAEAMPDPSQFFDLPDSGFIDDFTAPRTGIVNEIDLFPELEREIARMTSSQKAIIKTLSRSRTLEESADEFFATAKRTEETCINGAAEAARLFQEFNSYPKAPLHYLSSFPPAEKQRIEAIPDERLQMAHIKHFELFRVNSQLLKSIVEMTGQMRHILESLPEAERSKQVYQDLLPSFAEISEKATAYQYRLNEWHRQQS